MNNEILTYYYTKYSDYVYRLAFVYIKNHHDAEDILQNAFVKLFNSNIMFESDEHAKNWLMKVTVNESKNLKLRAFYRKDTVLEDTYIYEDKNDQDFFNLIMGLPDKLRVIILLYYYEEYKIKDIAKTLKTSESYIQNRLLYARKLLKKMI